MTVYQEDDWIGSARVHTEVYEQMVGEVQVRVNSWHLGLPSLDVALDLAALRGRLEQTLDDASLDAFCLDHFPWVYDRFGRGMRKDEKLTILLDYCRHDPARYDKLVALLPRATERGRFVAAASREKEPSESLAQVTVTIEGSIEEFTAQERESFVFTLARLLGTAPEQIRILHVVPGSVQVTLEMPSEFAARLESLYSARDPLLGELRIIGVERLLGQRDPLGFLAVSAPSVVAVSTQTAAKRPLFQEEPAEGFRGSAGKMQMLNLVLFHLLFRLVGYIARNPYARRVASLGCLGVAVLAGVVLLIGAIAIWVRGVHIGPVILVGLGMVLLLGVVVALLMQSPTWREISLRALRRHLDVADERVRNRVIVSHEEETPDR